MSWIRPRPRHRPRIRHRGTQQDLIVHIHPDDEMYREIARIDAKRPEAHYLDSGRRALIALEEALDAADRPLAGPMLDFACGHGRVTRHLVRRVDDVTVADIHPGAVQFVTRTWHLAGFVSMEDPSELRHRNRYQTIWVASLFTHLAIHRWNPWMTAMIDMLAPGGTLVFSANRPDRHGLPEIEQGFHYGPHNETGGRLPSDDYGTTDVSPEWVEAAVAASGGQVLCRLTDHLWGVQDLYVAVGPDAAPAAGRETAEDATYDPAFDTAYDPEPAPEDEPIRSR